MPSNSPEYNRAYRRNLRLKLIKELGGVCVFCSETDVIKLTFDHKNGYDGKLSPNGTRGGFRNLQHIRKLVENGRKNEVRILCISCNVRYQRWLEGWDPEKVKREGQKWRPPHS